MPPAPQSAGRCERNKQVKLDSAAARELFAERGADEVTTQQIADEADIGTGTLFLSAKTKGELLLPLVQNSLHAEALAQGRADAENAPDAVGAVMAIAQPVVAPGGSARAMSRRRRASCPPCCSSRWWRA
ncbi:helix-turn-helix domain-containing protein [Streptomyces sp. NPDC050848]|uniref:helix-turn-helix domain-containing protein n=1 Tax=Streptomyces sp. NPDC050848 TaxID=3155791 RepID=UPI0033CEA6EF